MAVPRLYVPDALAFGAVGTLIPSQAKQLRSVLRLSSGARIVLFNGSGVEAEASVEMLGKDSVSFEVLDISSPDRVPPTSLTVGLGLLRGERFEIAVQKLTEIGVTRIVPLAAERSVVSFDAAREWERRSERYARIMREAAEQSERVTLVAIDAPVTPAEFFNRQPTIALVERADATPIASVSLEPTMAIAVGPEGGWSPREIAAMDESGCASGSLGCLIYRAETAAIVAAGTLIQRAWAAHDTNPDIDTDKGA